MAKRTTRDERGTFIGSAHLEPGEELKIKMPANPIPIDAASKREKSHHRLNPGESATTELAGAKTLVVVNTDKQHAIDVEVWLKDGVLDIRLVKTPKPPNGEAHEARDPRAAYEYSTR